MALPGFEGMFEAWMKELEDSQSPYWDILLYPSKGPSGRARSSGIIKKMQQHPVGHDCSICKIWRKEYDNREKRKRS